MAEQGHFRKPNAGVLSNDQQRKLRQFKIVTRLDNERYLRVHPEVEVLIGDFLRDVLLIRPADIREFAADHFSNPNLRLAIVAKLERVQGDPEPNLPCSS